ncbi:MAG TPA: hypothetical protein VMS64_17705 [Candidatus Methylomirabilis sp.]|nr:hypothetical protein [Candidatus Methylomirabilis sp.]
MRTSRFVARFDSASGMLEALAHYLRGEDFPGLGIIRYSKIPFLVVNKLPSGLRQRLYRMGAWREGLPPEQVGHVRAEALAQWVVEKYPRRRYPAVMIGSSNGALLHLACALGVPWLPQTLLMPVGRRGVHTDDIREIVAATEQPAQELLRANPELAVYQMHDPNQDRLMSQIMAYFRVKRLRLGATYERFIEDTVAPGGTIIVVECQLSAPAAKVGERHFFQTGGLGDIPLKEYVEGSARIEAFLRREGSHRTRWDPPEPDGEHPESEWGFDPALREDVERLAYRHGYRIRRLVFDHPQDVSPLMADFHRAWYRERGMAGQRLIGESFVQCEPWWMLRTGSVPYWSFFSVEDAAARLETYLDETEPYDDIRLMLFSHGVESIGLASIARWRATLARARRGGGFLGVDERAFPQDFSTFVRYHDAMRAIPDRYPLPEAVPVEKFEHFLRRTTSRYAVAWESSEPS